MYIAQFSLKKHIFYVLGSDVIHSSLYTKIGAENDRTSVNLTEKITIHFN